MAEPDLKASGDEPLPRWVITYTLIPTNFNKPESVVVEAATAQDAQAIVRDHVRDLGPYRKYVYETKPYTPPPPGRIVGRP